MIDVAAYALLKRGISTSGTTSSEIADAKIENGHLILVLKDGSTIDCGALPAAGIDDESVSTDTTWSSARIEEAIEAKTYNLIQGGSAMEW